MTYQSSARCRSEVVVWVTALTRESAKILALAGLEECLPELKRSWTRHPRSLSLALTSGLDLAFVVFSPRQVPVERMEVVLEQPAGKLPMRTLLDLEEEVRQSACSPRLSVLQP